MTATRKTERETGSPRAELLAELRKSKQALVAFEAMPASHQQRWVEFVAEAKKAETRARRIGKCVAELSTAAPRGTSSSTSGKPVLQKLGIEAGDDGCRAEQAHRRPAASRRGGGHAPTAARGGPARAKRGGARCARHSWTAARVATVGPDDDRHGPRCPPPRVRSSRAGRRVRGHRHQPAAPHRPHRGL